jgi:hypothetical protein
MKTLRIGLMIIAGAALLAGCRGMSGESIEIVADIPAEPGTEFQLQNVTGSIRIEGETRDSVDITARVTDACRTSYARYVDVNDVTIDITTDDGMRVAHSPFDAGNIRVDYDLHVPSELDVQSLRTVTGDIMAVGIAGDATLTTTTGDVRVNGIDGELTATVVTGDILVLDAESIRTLRTVTGDVEAELLGTPSDNGAIVVKTTTGAIVLAIDPSLQLSIEASVVTGQITVESGLGFIGAGTSRHVEGTLNGGGISLVITATTGGIHLMQAQ